MDNDTHKLIRKLLRRHRSELTGIIGCFRASNHGEHDSLKLTASGGRIYKASATRAYGDGRPDWLNVDDLKTGRFVATLE